MILLLITPGVFPPQLKLRQLLEMFEANFPRTTSIFNLIHLLVMDKTTRIMINKGMFNKGKYWIFGKNKGVSVSNFEETKGRNKNIQYWISFQLKQC